MGFGRPGFGRRCLPLRGKVRAAPQGLNVSGLRFFRRRVPSCRRHASHAGKGGSNFLASAALPYGQGALPGCGFDAVCPAGKGAAEWRAVFWRIAEKTGFRCVLPIRKLSRRAGGRSCGIRLIAPLFAANIRGGAAVETNFSSFTTFSRPQNPNFPPFPPQPHPPTIPPLQTPQADGPCAWAVRRVCVLPPEQKRNEAPKPPARGAWAREYAANGTGRRHCRPGGLCPHPLKGPDP